MNFIKNTNALTACILFQVVSAFFCITLYAQNTAEWGIGLGATQYKGEVAPAYNFSNSMPAATVFYRRDFSPAITLRAAVMGGLIEADDRDVELPLHAYRGARFESTVIDFSLGFEYNFLDYYDMTRRQRWTPYFFLSGALFYYSNETTVGQPGNTAFDQQNSGFSASIPVGAGIKFALSRHWNLGLEFGARKTFTDKFDNLTDQYEKKIANPYDNDWYYFTGVTLSYTIYNIPCPSFYKDIPGLLE